MPRSPLAVTAVVWLSVTLALTWGGGQWLASLEAFFADVFSLRAMGAGEGFDPAAPLAHAAAVGAGILVWPLASILVAGSLASSLVGGISWSPAALKMDLARLAPSRNLGRGLGRGALLARLGALLAVVLVGAVLLAVLRDALAGIFGRVEASPRWLATTALRVGQVTAWRLAALLLVVGAVAATAGRLRWWAAQRMTRRERQQEERESEGDPLTRRRRGGRHRELARTPSVREVLADTSLVVRADGLAVALGWANREEAPSVVAVLRGAAAARFVVSSDAPRSDDPGLALELARVPRGHAVPERLWTRVARPLSRAGLVP